MRKIKIEKEKNNANKEDERGWKLIWKIRIGRKVEKVKLKTEKVKLEIENRKRKMNTFCKIWKMKVKW